MEREDIINRFKGLDINLHPAGIWEFDEQGNKKAKVAFRQDSLPLESYPQDNMFKLRIDETPYMVIDVDGGDIMGLYRDMPSLSRTLTTTTTKEGKYHIYIVKPDDFPTTRVINSDTKIDLLSNGIVFEGHLYNINPLYDIENSEIVTLTPNEISFLKGLVPAGIKSYESKIANKRFVPWEKQLVEEYLKGTLKDERKLWKALTPKSEQKQGKTNYEAPPLAYDTFNTTAFYLALNEYIPHDMVISFLEKMLVKEHGMSLSSSQTQQRLYKQIIPTLPIYETDDYNDSFDNHIAKAPVSRDDRFKVVRTIDNAGNPKYVLLDKFTHIPQQINSTILRAQKAVQYLYPTLDSDTWTYGLPEVELTSNPYLPQKSYSFDRHVFTLSTLQPTQYLMECGELSEKPHNILTKAIERIFLKTPEATSSVDPEDFYYHWLAHIIFSTKQMSTIFSLSTDSTVQGGTGKSTFTAKLPMHILPRGTVFTVDEGTASWGDAFYNSKLTCFDDLHDTDKWKKLYTTMKRETSGTIQKKNIKGGATVNTDVSACLTISSNFLPKIDETDRRFFIWSPSEKLSQNEGLEIARIMSDFNIYHQEIQDIVSYCKYLYNNFENKYTKELYIEAPTTSFNNNAKIEGATSEKLISMIKHGPDAVFDAFVPNKKNKLNKHEIVDLILDQVGEPSAKSNGKYTFHLPQELFVVLLNATRDEDVTNQSSKKIAFMIGATFSTLNMNYTKYRKDKRFSDWTTRGLRLHVEEETVNKYKNWKKYNQPQSLEIKEQVDV